MKIQKQNLTSFESVKKLFGFIFLASFDKKEIFKLLINLIHLYTLGYF